MTSENQDMMTVYGDLTVGELIRALSYWSPDTKVELLDGNLLTNEILGSVYGEDEEYFEDINDGYGGKDNTLYLLTE